MSTHTRRRAILAAATALLSAGSAAPLSAQGSPSARVRVPVTGRTVEVTLVDSTRVRGELIEAIGGELLVLEGAGSRVIPLDGTAHVRYQRHGWTWRRGLTWTVIGALVSGAGLAVACSQVETADCGGLFPRVAVLWVAVGLPASAAMDASAWQELPPQDHALRPYARFPQGAPEGFGARTIPERPGGGPPPSS